jgi:hypothetical protein
VAWLFLGGLVFMENSPEVMSDQIDQVGN